MLAIQLKTAFRALHRDQFYVILNLFGLAIGMAAALLIFVWVQDEMTFDRQHKKGANIARVLTNWNFGGKREWTPSTPAPLAPAAKAEIPEVQEAVRTWRMWRPTIAVGPALFEAERAMIVDKAFFELFDFQTIRSDGSQPLASPNGILLTEKLAKTIFADADPLGKTLKFDNKIDLVVTGIVADPPSNSSIRFSCLLPWEPLANQLTSNPQNSFHWGNMSFTTYVLLRPDADRLAVMHKMSNIVARNRVQHVKDPSDNFWYGLQPLRDIHLYSDGYQMRGGFELGDRKTTGIFGSIGLLILAIACINYVNLATARATRRAKEVGVRKTVGAGSGQLFLQFLSESGMLIALAAVVAWLLAVAALPFFNDLADKNFTQHDFLQPTILRVVAAAAGLALLLAGVYPAVLLTKFETVKVLKGVVSTPRAGGQMLRKGLVTTQFVFSIALIISALVMSQQLDFFLNAKLGYEREQIFSFNIWGSTAKSDVFKREMEGKPGIQSIAVSDNQMVDLGSQNSGMEWDGQPKGTELPIWQIGVDSDFPKFFGIELVAGRWFRPEMNGWDSTAFIFNETAIRTMGFSSPTDALGKRVKYQEIEGSVAGVVRDFHFQSLHKPIESLIIYQNPEWLQNFYVKTKASEASAAIASAQAAFQKFMPSRVFRYQFLDEEYDELYKTEARAGLLFKVFAGLAVLISLLGLLGLATFNAVQRTKEIGIRKVLGGSVASIAGLLTRDFALLVVAAVAVAVPMAWFFMKNWLSDFAYRIELEWWFFAGAGAVALLLAGLTVGFQSVRAALANPVKSLRSE